MKLSKLIFECVRDSIVQPNNDFDYADFLKGEYNADRDYVNQIVSVFGATNLAIARLQDQNKIPLATTTMSIDSNTFTFTLGKLVNIVSPSDNCYRRLEYRTLEMGNKYFILDSNVPNIILVEYKKRIPHFDKTDLVELEEVEGEIVDNNIDLEEYGIDNLMCEYIKEFVKGQIFEILSPEMANLHNNRAEQYLNDIKTNNTSLYQNRVKIDMGGML